MMRPVKEIKAKIDELEKNVRHQEMQLRRGWELDAALVVGGSLIAIFSWFTGQNILVVLIPAVFFYSIARLVFHFTVTGPAHKHRRRRQLLAEAMREALDTLIKEGGEDRFYNRLDSLIVSRNKQKGIFYTDPEQADRRRRLDAWVEAYTWIATPTN
jgi:hypothetical protein